MFHTCNGRESVWCIDDSVQAKCNTVADCGISTIKRFARESAPEHLTLVTASLHASSPLGRTAAVIMSIIKNIGLHGGSVTAHCTLRCIKQSRQHNCFWLVVWRRIRDRKRDYIAPCRTFLEAYCTHIPSSTTPLKPLQRFCTAIASRCTPATRVPNHSIARLTLLPSPPGTGLRTSRRTTTWPACSRTRSSQTTSAAWPCSWGCWTLTSGRRRVSASPPGLSSWWGRTTG